MRHRNHSSKLNRTSEHRLALMRNLSIALLDKERIRTTQAKASQLRSFFEPLVTLARAGDQYSRRLAFSRLGAKEAVHKLFSEIGPRVSSAGRSSGYVRVVKDAPRVGDGALMAYVEFVDRPVKAADDKKPSLEQRMKKKMHERRKEAAKMRR